jgi:colanic acid biosynthesis protein WcaH
MNAPLLTSAQFSEACNALPLVSIDLVITTTEGQLLLGKRNNAPARNFWFTPGGRIRKNEALTAAKGRIAHDELGLPASVWERATLMGAWDHFYEDSAFSPEVSTHYVNLPHWLQIGDDEKNLLQLPQGPNEQHSSWQWFNLAEIETEKTVHQYARSNAKWIVDRLAGH